ncbi:hypothetical protein [Ureaplasma ceti]|uniref:Uncharacterized protein n=1 Tax=Ureaplasma ceti TaxID=3119530 RepID=A0ABP9U724_9BACT
MIKKWMWVTPLMVAAVGGLTAGVVGGYFANVRGNPYRDYASAPAGHSNIDLMQMYFASAVNDTKLMVLPGYLHTKPLTQALAVTAQQNAPMHKYLTKSGFILLDDTYGMPIWNKTQLDRNTAQPLWSTQVAAMKFRTDLGSFITGIAAGEFLNEYQYYFAPRPQDELTFATYGGGPFSSVTGYMGGLQRGIRYFNEYIVPFAKTLSGQPYKKIKELFVGKTEVANFSNGFGPTQGDALINYFLSKNVSLLMPVAAGQTQRAVRLIKQNHKRTIVLGVDSANEDDTNSNLTLSTPGYQAINGTTKIGGTDRIIQFSSMKKLDVATALLAKNIYDGVVAPKLNSTIGGFGCNSLGTPENDCVGLSVAGYQYFVRAIQLALLAHQNNLNTLPADTKLNMSVTGQTIAQAEINKVFAVPNNNPKTNLPSDPEYNTYWLPLYQKYLKVINATPTFKTLNQANQKVFYAIEDWEPGQATNNEFSFSYADLPNEHQMMMPLDAWGTITNPLAKPEFATLEAWFQKYSTNSSDANLNHERLQNLKQWFIKNQTEIRYRNSFNLIHAMNKKSYQNNKSVFKVLLSSPLDPLLDKGFSQSAYMGLLEYWQLFGINLPNPNVKK